MTYRFTGFLVPGLQNLAPAAALPNNAVVREIREPFSGVGIALPSLNDKDTPPAEVLKIADGLGLAHANCWLFIQYVTWGGRIDSVYAIGAGHGHSFGPVEDSNGETVDDSFEKAMGHIGVNRDAAHRFEPFERGYWGD